MQPKTQLKDQYIGICEEIDSFYWPKMHFLKEGQKNQAWVGPPPLIRAMPERKVFFFNWCLPLSNSLCAQVSLWYQPLCAVADNHSSWTLWVNPFEPNVSLSSTCQLDQCRILLSSASQRRQIFRASLWLKMFGNRSRRQRWGAPSHQTSSMQRTLLSSCRFSSMVT